MTPRTRIVIEVSDDLLAAIDGRASSLMAATRRPDNSLVSRDEARSEVCLLAVAGDWDLNHPKAGSVEFWQEWREREEGDDVK